MVRVAAQRRVVLERAEPLGQRHVLGPADVLVADEQHLVLEQQCPQFREQGVVAGDSAEVHVEQFGADVQVSGATGSIRTRR